MSNFVFVVAVLFGIDCLGKLHWLGSERIPTRTPGTVAWDLFMNLGIIAWAIYLLVR